MRFLLNTYSRPKTQPGSKPSSEPTTPFGAAAPSACTSLIGRHIGALACAVWPLVRNFANPQRYKHFIKSCHMREGDSERVGVGVGSVRDVAVISGFPASTSAERLEVLDDERRVLSFRVIGGDHRLRDYCSVTSLHEVTMNEERRKAVTLVLVCYAGQIPEGNTCEDTKLFADTIVKLNLQKLEEINSHGFFGQRRRRTCKMAMKSAGDDS